MWLDESAFPKGAKSEEILLMLWDGVERCLRAEIYLAAIVMMSSLLEGVLFFRLRENRKAAHQCSCAPKRDGKVKDFAKWKLGEMINAALEMGWMGHGIGQFSHSVRDLRNLIHPAKQFKNAENPRPEIADISWRIVQRAIREVEKFHSGKGGHEFLVMAKLADESAVALVVGGGAVASTQNDVKGDIETTEMDPETITMMKLMLGSGHKVTTRTLIQDMEKIVKSRRRAQLALDILCKKGFIREDHPWGEDEAAVCITTEEGKSWCMRNSDLVVPNDYLPDLRNDDDDVPF